ncbi:hypothetical protein [Paeniglutamicibacter sp. Y32M11]|uniref:hypothetical protein n=1 Tax=Paeniglutamicibacter sp. Y32M11 TaxID=2853258 RepID=UPI001C528DAF|nr:hypothetical protein [Paeniglutamicibacter sp. Y32M11]QXQ09937.1 hypothetical protein KUF55_16090 [Paeniglutamicibacter sp. Y32M11]
MPKQLKVAVVAAVLLVLLMSAQGTAALWRADGTIDAGTVSTGNMHLLAGSGPATKQNYEFTDLDGANLVPGQFVQAPLTITNSGTTDLDYNLTGATTLPASPTLADTALAEFSTLTIAAGLSATECSARNTLTAPLYKGPAVEVATFVQARALTTTTDSNSEVLCVRVEILPSAPQTAAGGRLNLVLNFTGQQQ